MTETSMRLSGWPVHRRILAISLPAILANSSAPLVGLVDTWAVGHLPGARHLAAVGLGTIIFNYLFWAFGFLRMGTTGLVAQAWGREDLDGLAREVLRSVILSLVLGVLLILLGDGLLLLSLKVFAPPADVAVITSEYFDIRIWAAPATLLVYTVSGALFGLGRTGQVLVLQLVLNLANAGLNLWLVVGRGMGVPGVALGTVIAQWLAAALGAWMLAGLPGADRLHGMWRSARTWRPAGFRRLVVLNSFIFIRTLFLMTALAMIMRESVKLGEVGMAASHVLNQYMMLIALGLDGFAHAAEALAGQAWGHGQRQRFRRWVYLTGLWAVIASGIYSLAFWWAGDAVTALLTDLEPVRELTAGSLPLLVALPVVAVWCYHFDGVYIGATAARAMMLTMGLSFVVYALIVSPMTDAWGLNGLWGAVLVFMGLRGVLQAIGYPLLWRRLPA